jgi:amino acid transporter
MKALSPALKGLFNAKQRSDVEMEYLALPTREVADGTEARERNLSLSDPENRTASRATSPGAAAGGLDGTGKKPRNKTLGAMALCALTYYSVSGGPFGFESVVAAGGPFWALAGFGLVFVWALPEALITIEMSIVFPEASGSVAWVEAAFGAKWGFIKGWLSVLSGIADNSLYPLLFVDCAVQLFEQDDEGNLPLDESPWTRYAITMSITLALTYLNYRGLDLVGKLAIFVCLFSLAPFVVFCILGAFKVRILLYYCSSFFSCCL